VEIKRQEVETHEAETIIEADDVNWEMAKTFQWG